MPSYIGTSIENQPAWMKREMKSSTFRFIKTNKNHIPTVQEVIKYIDCWLEFHNKNLVLIIVQKVFKKC